MARQQDESVLLYSGVSAPVIKQQEATGLSTTTYYKGDCVHIDNSGYITIATGKFILGMAVSRCTGVDYVDADVELIDFNALYLITAGASTAVARATIGETCDITYTPDAHVHAASTTNSVICVVGIYEGNDATTDGGRYIFRFNAAEVVAGT